MSHFCFNIAGVMAWKKTILYSGITLHILAAVYSVGHYHVDEHFQILEFAAYKCGNTPASDLAWEFHAALRPAIQPGLACIIYKLITLFGTVNPFVWAMLLRLLSVGLSIYAAGLVFKTFIRDQTNNKAEVLFWFITLLFWCMPYNHARFSSENWSGALFLIGLALYPYQNPRAGRYILISGFMVGLAVVCRYQAAFLVAGMGLWLLCIGRARWYHLLVFTLSVLAAMGIGVVVDYWFYGKWVITFWNYFDVNVIQNKAAEFGLEPWWYYVTEGISKLFVPFGLLVFTALLALLISRPRQLVIWIIIPFLLGHVAIGHKELRFVFPLLHLLPLLMVLVYRQFEKTIDKWLTAAWVRYTAQGLVIINLLMLIPVSTQPASKRVALLHYLYNHPAKHTVCLEQNPYKDQLWLNVYAPAGEQVKQYPVAPDSTLLTNVRVTVPEYKWYQRPAGYRQTYSQLPPFAESINVNNWLARTEFWSVYEPLNHTGSR